MVQIGIPEGIQRMNNEHVSGVRSRSKTIFETLSLELKSHAPFTFFGASTGILIMFVTRSLPVSQSMFETLFWILHPLHVFLSALVTTGMYRLYKRGKPITTFAIGYVGSIGIASISDCFIPYFGEILLDLPNRAIHLGFIEKWWIVNPLAIAGIVLAYFRPSTKFPHAGHVLLSTWASLFHMIIAMQTGLNLYTVLVVTVFLFLAVWLPCCTSDIIFPLVFAKIGSSGREERLV
jgi:hypothetical protein